MSINILKGLALEYLFLDLMGDGDLRRFVCRDFLPTELVIIKTDPEIQNKVTTRAQVIYLFESSDDSSLE